MPRGYGGGYGYSYRAPSFSDEDPLAAAIQNAISMYTTIRSAREARDQERREMEERKAEKAADRQAREAESARRYVADLNKQRREAAESGYQYNTITRTGAVPGLVPGMNLPPGVMSSYTKVGPSQREREMTLEAELEARAARDKATAEEQRTLSGLRAEAAALGIPDAETMDAPVLRVRIADARDQRKRTADRREFDYREGVQDRNIRGRQRSGLTPVQENTALRDHVGDAALGAAQANPNAGYQEIVAQLQRDYPTADPATIQGAAARAVRSRGSGDAFGNALRDALKPPGAAGPATPAADPKAEQRADWDRAADVLRQQGKDPVKILGARP